MEQDVKCENLQLIKFKVVSYIIRLIFSTVTLEEILKRSFNLQKK